MGFVKLDESILVSSVWVDRDVRDVWITCLIMAKPRVFDMPMPQLEVRRIAQTGFVAPPGAYGFVAAASTGIANRSLVGFEQALVALEVLGSPDPDSRSQDFEGRRLIRVDGGYLVLNYEKWRERDITSAERQRRWRERKKAQLADADDSNAQTLLRNENDALHNTKITEAEAEADVTNTSHSASSSNKSNHKQHLADFEKWWSRYPKRAGSNPKRAASLAYQAAIRRGVTPAELDEALDRYIAYIEHSGRVGTEFVKQAQFWLSPRFAGWEQEFFVKPETLEPVVRLRPKNNRGENP